MSFDGSNIYLEYIAGETFSSKMLANPREQQDERDFQKTDLWKVLESNFVEE